MKGEYVSEEIVRQRSLRALQLRQTLQDLREQYRKSALDNNYCLGRYNGFETSCAILDGRPPVRIEHPKVFHDSLWYKVARLFQRKK